MKNNSLYCVPRIYRRTDRITSVMESSTQPSSTRIEYGTCLENLRIRVLVVGLEYEYYKLECEYRIYLDFLQLNFTL